MEQFASQPLCLPLGIRLHTYQLLPAGAVRYGWQADCCTHEALSEAGSAWRTLKSVQDCKRR